MMNTYGYSGAFSARESSRFAGVGRVLGCALFIPASYWCTTVGSLKGFVAGWAGLVFFSMALVWALMQFFKPLRVVTISPDGFEDSHLAIGVVSWRDIKDASVRQVGRSSFLCMELHDESKYRARLGVFAWMYTAANRMLGYPMLTINFHGLDRSPSDALDAARTFLAANDVVVKSDARDPG